MIDLLEAQAKRIYELFKEMNNKFEEIEFAKVEKLDQSICVSIYEL